MLTKKAIFILLIVLSMGTLIHAQSNGTIVFVTYDWVNKIDPETGESPDMPHIYALEDAGYKVIPFYNGSLSTASTETLDTLYNANLIVMGRSTPSPGYGDHKETWNSIPTPTLCLNMWAARYNRLNWLNTTAVNYNTEEGVYNAIIDVPDDPVFEGLNTSAPVPWIIGPYDIMGVTEADNGTVLARMESDYTVLFVRWEPDEEFYDGSGDYPAGHRTLIGNGRDNAGLPPFDYYNFTAESEQVFLAEVARMVILGGYSKEIIVSCPDTSAAAGNIIDIPVLVEDVTGEGIFSVGLSVETNTNVLIPISASATSTLTESWGNCTWNINGGRINIGTYGTTPLAGSGLLVYVRYQVNANAAIGDRTTIHIAEVLFNEGEPEAAGEDGSFIVGGISIEGNISYYSNNQSVNDALVTITGITNEDVITDADGDYIFTDLLYGDYTSKPSKEDDLNSAISPYDASLILQHYVGLISFTPYQKIAADASGNGQVTPFDASQILQYWVGLIPNLPVMPDETHFWTFVPDSFLISDTNWTTAPDSMIYEPLNSNKDNQDYVGIIYGDPSGNWSPSSVLASFGKASSKSVTFHQGEVIWNQDNIITIPIKINDGKEIISAGFTFEYDSDVLKIVDVSTSELTSGYSITHKVTEGQLKVAMAGTKSLNKGGTIANIKCQALKQTFDSIIPLFLREVKVNEGEIVANIEGTDVSFLLAVPSEFALFQNYPNPFNPETMIKYQLPEKNRVVLKIFNLMGQEIRTLVNEDKDGGYYEIQWDGKDNSGQQVSSGIFIYKIQAGDFVQTKKMALIR